MRFQIIKSGGTQFLDKTWISLQEIHQYGEDALWLIEGWGNTCNKPSRLWKYGTFSTFCQICLGKFPTHPRSLFDTFWGHVQNKSTFPRIVQWCPMFLEASRPFFAGLLACEDKITWGCFLRVSLETHSHWKFAWHSRALNVWPSLSAEKYQRVNQAGNRLPPGSPPGSPWLVATFLMNLPLFVACGRYICIYISIYTSCMYHIYMYIHTIFHMISVYLNYITDDECHNVILVRWIPSPVPVFVLSKHYVFVGSAPMFAGWTTIVSRSQNH